MLHAVLAGERSADGLTDDQRWVVERCQELAQGLIEQLGLSIDREWKEERLWGSRPACYSGKPDRLILDVGCSYALVIDYKTGRGVVPPADRNYQMRALAHLVQSHTGATTVAVAIIQPRATESGPVTLSVYGARDTVRADREVKQIIGAALDAYAERIPGDEQCRYCRARGICPEASAQAVAITEDARELIHRSEVLAGPDNRPITSEDFAAILPKLHLADNIIKSIRQRAKAFVAAGGTIPGYELKPGASQREITDPQGAYAKLADSVTPAEFMAACSIGIGALKTLCGEKTGLKGGALDAWFNETFADAMQLNPTAPKLVPCTREIEEGKP